MLANTAASIGSPTFWTAFGAIVLVMLALDLGVFHRKSHTVSLREAGLWSCIWISLALLFNLAVWRWFGPERGLEFLAGYLIEYSLSVDNIFVFVLLFSTFAVPAAYQHRVLFWGILGAFILRAIFVWAGAELLERFHWAIYVFGGFLVLTAFKMLRQMEPDDPAQSKLVKFVQRIIPCTPGYEGDRFFVRHTGKLVATPLFVVLIAVEFTDLVFAVDSIPAIFAVTTDPFLVYTSNVFAILGLRSLYFLLAGVVHKFVYLRIGLALVLGFVGAKMLLSSVYKVPIGWSLAIIALLLGGSIAASLLRKEPAPAPGNHPHH
jgi:tellurite resistance protein TerC